MPMAVLGRVALGRVGFLTLDAPEADVALRVYRVEDGRPPVLAWQGWPGRGAEELPLPAGRYVVRTWSEENGARDLQEVEESDGSLLDNTMVLYGCHMGDANIHNNLNLPILLAGGGFRHGQHLAFDPHNNTPLCNVFVSMLQKMGIEADRFGSSKGTLTGLA